MVYTASRSSHCGTHHSVIDWYADVAQVALALSHEDVFTFKDGRGGTEPNADGKVVNLAPDLLAQGTQRLASGIPLREYKAKARVNWARDQQLDTSFMVDGEPGDDDDLLDLTENEPGVAELEDFQEC